MEAERRRQGIQEVMKHHAGDDKSIIAHVNTWVGLRIQTVSPCDLIGSRAAIAFIA